MEIVKVPASHGLKWLLQGFVLLRRNFFVWLAFIVMLWVLVFIVSRIKFASPVLGLLTPVFIAGLMIGARAIEKGERLEIAHLFAGFRTHTLSLLATGAFYLVGNIAILAVMSAIGGPEIEQIAKLQAGQSIDPEVLMPIVGPAMAALLVGMVLSIPLTMALWFAPLLVVFRNERPGAALRLSFQGCIRNMAAFLVYSLVLVVPLILLMLPFDLTSMDRNPGLWIVSLLVLPSLYTSYRDIYADAIAPSTTTVPPPAT